MTASEVSVKLKLDDASVEQLVALLDAIVEHILAIADALAAYRDPENSVPVAAGRNVGSLAVPGEPE